MAATPLRGRTLSRRTFLRGAGAAMALPLLDAMVPTRGWAQSPAQPTTRFLAYYVPNGFHMPSWHPPEGDALRLSPILEPLNAVRDAITVISGLDNAPARPEGPGDHAGGTGAFLTASSPHKTEGANIRNGVSIDQLIAQQVGQGHRFSSLVLGAEGGGNAGGCDSGYSCAYVRNISWVNETTPAAKEVTPRTVFARMFGSAADGLSAAQLARQTRYRRSILDLVRGDAERLRVRLGPTDRRKMESYLDSVREVERQIELAESQRCDAGPAPEQPEDLRDTIRQLSDLMVLAFQCDLTPVCTFMLGNGGSNRPYPFLGISDGHHQLSHHQGNQEYHRQLEIINHWEIEQLAYLLGRMAAIEEAGGSLLDNSVVFFSSEIEDGDSHRHYNLPVVLAGGASGQLRGGRVLRLGNRPIADLFIALGQMTGADVSRFGFDGTAALELG